VALGLTVALVALGIMVLLALVGYLIDKSADERRK
jgi:hypothetical protein